MDVVEVLSEWEPYKKTGLLSFGSDGEYEKRRVIRKKYETQYCDECESDQPVTSDPFVGYEDEDTCMTCLYHKAMDLATQTMGEIEAHKAGATVEDWETRTIKPSAVMAMWSERLIKEAEREPFFTPYLQA